MHDELTRFEAHRTAVAAQAAAAVAAAAAKNKGPPSSRFRPQQQQSLDAPSPQQGGDGSAAAGALPAAGADTVDRCKEMLLAVAKNVAVGSLKPSKKQKAGEAEELLRYVCAKLWDGWMSTAYLLIEAEAYVWLGARAVARAVLQPADESGGERAERRQRSGSGGRRRSGRHVQFATGARSSRCSGSETLV